RLAQPLGPIKLAKMQATVSAFELAPATAAHSPAPQSNASAKTSIAVLPFLNMSDSKDQQYFCDGITEDIITDLARWRSLAVTSRNSTFRYKGESVDVVKVGHELGVRFLLEGSIRRVADRVRISAQLIECDTGSHVWAERYDRPANDLFEVQDDVVRKIVGTIVGRVSVSEVERVSRTAPSTLA